MTIFELSDQYVKVAAVAENMELPPEAIADTFEALDGEFDDKADNLACIIKQLSAEGQAIKEQEDALKARRQAKEKASERLKSLLSMSMQRIGRERIDTARNLITFRKSIGLRIEDEDDFVQRHRDLCKVETVVTIPKKEITDRLKAGEEISGATLETRQNLQIK